MAATSAAPAAPAVADLSSTLYLSLILTAVLLARVGPLNGGAPRLPGSLVGSVDDEAYAALYLLCAALLIVAYLPCAASLAVRGGGRPLLLMCAVALFVVASAPLESAFRTRHDESGLARRAVSALALAAWPLSLAPTLVGALWAFAFFGTSWLAPRLSVATLLIQCAGFAILHHGLGMAAPLPLRSQRWRWRLGAPLVLVPLLALTLTAVVLTGGHAFFRLHERPVNHAGVPLCPFRHTTVLPTSVEGVQAMVQAHASLRPKGAAHSWSSLACPQVGGVVLDTRILRRVAYDPATETLAAGAGTTFATLTNVLHRHNRMLAANWHRDVTVAGACATAAQHLGVSIHSLVTQLEVVYANGTLGTVRETDEAFPFHFGSIGLLGVIVAVTLRTLPRAPLEWTSTTEAYADNDAALAARVASWADAPNDELRSSVLWILPSLRETTLQVASYGAPLAPPDAATWRVDAPHVQRQHWGDVGLTFSLFNNGLALLVGLFAPLTLSLADAVAEAGARSFVQDYTQSQVSTPHLTATSQVDEYNNLLPTRVATVEMAVSIGRAELEACVTALAALPVMTVQHLRYAALAPRPLVTSGPQTYHIDFSLPESVLHALHKDLERAVHACPPPTRADGFAAAEGHAGKLDLPDLLKRRVWTAPTAAALPGRTQSVAHTRFRELVAELDPTNKFGPYQET